MAPYKCIIIIIIIIIIIRWAWGWKVVGHRGAGLEASGVGVF